MILIHPAGLSQSHGGLDARSGIKSKAGEAIQKLLPIEIMVDNGIGATPDPADEGGLAETNHFAPHFIV